MKESPRIIACSKTDPGLCRPRNEDVAAADVERGVFMVADGMGGVAGGEVASALFLSAVREIFTAGEKYTLTHGQTRVRRAFLLANDKILGHAAANPSLKGMGCTAELLFIGRDSFILGHVGDSRTYLLRDHRLDQLTRDHSLAQEHVDRGLLTREQAETSLYRHILLRAVGVDTEPAVDITAGELRPGDLFLLCTDGLHSAVPADEILPILACDIPLVRKAGMLIDRANAAGGRDNISVTLVANLG